MTDVTFIVCTRNRAKPLPNCLDSIARAIDNVPEMACELIVVNNGSTDDTAAVIDKWKKNIAFPVVTTFEQKAGLGVARNTGLRLAHGALIVLTDDDCEINPNYVSEMRAHFAGDNQPVIRGGRVKLGDPTDLPLTVKDEDETVVYLSSMYPGGFILGCNTVMARGVYEKLGGFDERFGAGAPFKSGEDAEYLYRAHLAGIPLIYVPDMLVLHFHGRKEISQARELIAGYFYGNGAMTAKYVSHVKLVKYIYWDFRKTVKEIFGGPIFDAQFGISYKLIFSCMMRGFVAYFVKR